jgi:hypothetical protein
VVFPGIVSIGQISRLSLLLFQPTSAPSIPHCPQEMDEGLVSAQSEQEDNTRGNTYEIQEIMNLINTQSWILGNLSETTLD